MNKAPNPRIDEFEGLRGLMALLVFFSHLLLMAGISAHELPKPLGFLTWGGTAVEVFIMLSGFVIFMLLDRTHESYGGFIRRRFFRLFPAYAICLAAGVGLSFHAHAILQAIPWHAELGQFDLNWKMARDHFWPQVFWHLTMLHGIWPNEVLPFSVGAFLDQAWSVSLEWQFYLVAPLLWLILRRKSPLIWPILAAVAGAAFLSEHTGSYFRAGQHLTYPLKAFLPLQSHFFFVGILSYFIFRRARETDWQPPRLFFPCSVLAAFLFLPASLGIWIAVFGSSLYAHHAEKPLEARALSHLLTRPIAAFLGRISYSIYLVHFGVIYGAAWLLTTVRGGWTKGSFLAALTALALPVVLALSWAMFRFVEKPAMNWAKRSPEGERIAPAPQPLLATES